MLLLRSKLPQFLKNLLSRQFLGFQIRRIFLLDRGQGLSPSRYFLWRERNILYAFGLGLAFRIGLKLVPFLACKIDGPIP